MVGLERFLPQGLGKLTMFGCPPIRLSLPGVCVRHESHKEKPRQHTRAQHLKGKYTKELFLPPLTPIPMTFIDN